MQLQVNIFNNDDDFKSKTNPLFLYCNKTPLWLDMYRLVVVS